jgi:hypothetical protein
MNEKIDIKWLEVAMSQKISIDEVRALLNFAKKSEKL